jgi:photosystem II stability/assembly factor-like uncharacterized protein
MRTKISLAAIIFFLSLNFSFAQWIQQNSGTNINLNRIQFVNSQTGWAGGFQAIPVYYMLIKTTNAGISWTDQRPNLPTGNRILSLFFIDANTGWIAGADGFFKTTNGGASYFTLTSPSIICNDVYFVNPLTGWVTGLTGSNGKLDKTTDGGSTWITQAISIPQNEQLYSLHFENSLTGWGAGGTSIIKTTDGGTSWTTQSHPSCTGITCVNAVSSDIAWVSGNNGIILSTTNGGSIWTANNVGYSYTVFSVFFINSSTGFSVTGPSKIFKTTNGGTNWYTQLTDTSTNRFNCVYFKSNDTGYVSGSQGKIYKTINAGGTIGIKEINENIPDKYDLFQNYPNPFNPTTRIRFQIADFRFQIKNNNKTTLKVFDITGREIQALVNELLSPGTYEVTFDGSNLPSGIYFYQLRSGDFVESKKLILIK